MLSLSSKDPWSSVEHSRLREKQIPELSSIRARAGTWTSDWSQRPALSRPAALGPSPIILKQPEKPRKPSQQTHIQMIPGPWTKLTESKSFAMGPSESYILSSSPRNISAYRSLTSSRVRAQQPDKDNGVSRVDGWDGLGQGTEARPGLMCVGLCAVCCHGSVWGKGAKGLILVEVLEGAYAERPPRSGSAAPRMLQHTKTQLPHACNAQTQKHCPQDVQNNQTIHPDTHKTKGSRTGKVTCSANTVRHLEGSRPPEKARNVALEHFVELAAAAS
ncbi:hypothetical protein MG293_017595 [Ovis ammon polii]|uniref:Uncharacterized protein n=1 Tax=Ovis ammon polii TaxID=230172 RepID=A0AAD4XZS7_OVIAM|nr:hypothetical protein MG293_017595 [Ovis ammon polii]